MLLISNVYHVLVSTAEGTNQWNQPEPNNNKVKCLMIGLVGQIIYINNTQWGYTHVLLKISILFSS